MIYVLQILSLIIRMVSYFLVAGYHLQCLDFCHWSSHFIFFLTLACFTGRQDLFPVLFFFIFTFLICNKKLVCKRAELFRCCSVVPFSSQHCHKKVFRIFVCFRCSCLLDQTFFQINSAEQVISVHMVHGTIIESHAYIVFIHGHLFPYSYSSIIIE
jgi:hypothetical protein